MGTNPKYEVVCLKNNRDRFDELTRLGWGLFRRYMPVERTVLGKVKTNFWWMKRPESGDGAGVDLTEINQALDDLSAGYAQCLAANHEQGLRIAVLEQTPSGGGADFSTRNIPLEIYGGLSSEGIPIIQNVGAIDLRPKYTRAKLSGNILSIRFSIQNGGKLNDGTYYIKLLDPEIKGYHYPTGVAKWHGNRHDQTLDCHAEWQQYGADWFIRMPIYNYDYYGAKLNIDFGKDYPDLGVKSAAVQVPGTSYLGKRCPVVAQNDTVIVTMPVFPL